MHHDMDDTPGAWHLGAIDDTGRIVATSSYYSDPYPVRPHIQPAVQLAFMAVDPRLQGRGIGSRVMLEAIRRLKATDAVLLWASARDAALPFYTRFGFAPEPAGRHAPPETGRPHTLIALDLTATPD